MRKKALGASMDTIPDLSEDELRAIPAVKQAFDDARTQVTRYQAALKERLGDLLNLRSFTMVAIDLTRVVAEEHPSV